MGAGLGDVVFADQQYGPVRPACAAGRASADAEFDVGGDEGSRRSRRTRFEPSRSSSARERQGDPGFWAFLEKLALRHGPLHLHATNYRGFTMVLDLRLLRRDVDTFPGLATAPIRPNHPNVADIRMTPFGRQAAA